MGTRPKTFKGKVSVHHIGYNTYYEEHGASSRKLSLLSSLPSSHVDESTIHWFYIPDQQATQNKHAIPNPAFVDLREFRKHIEVDARQRRNKFNLFPAWKYMFSMVISTLP